jgi:hypothetical protein
MVNKRPKIVKTKKNAKRPNVGKLATSQLTSTTSETEDEEVNPPPRKVSQPVQNNIRVKQKPITINNSTVEAIKVLLSQLKLNSIVHHKILSEGNIQIIPWNYEDKINIIDKLKSMNLKYFTYSEYSERQLIFVLKRHFFVSTTDMLALLKLQGIPATKVSFLNSNEKMPSYLVNFEKNSINFFTLTNTFNIIDGLVIKWEKLNKQKKKITQCHKCQTYGHSATNCGRDYRCVKCLDNHLPGQCQRKTRDGAPKCVNCHMDHAANSKNCKFFVTYKEKIEKSKKINHLAMNNVNSPSLVKQKTATNNLAMNNINFPSLLNQKTAINNVRTNKQQTGVNAPAQQDDVPTPSGQQSIFDDFADVQSEFASISGIENTLANFKKFTSLLKATTNEKQRFAIIIQYCGV